MKESHIENANHRTRQRPLCVDLDGTLIRSDSLRRAFLLLLRKNCFQALFALVQLLKGKWAYKHYLADHVKLDPRSLLYNDELMAWLHSEKAKGREIILATASEPRFAMSIADHVSLFSTCFASDAKTNLKGKNKAALLNKHYGRGRYDYAGNHHADYAVWRDAHDAIVVNASAAVLRKARRIANVTKVIS